MYRKWKVGLRRSSGWGLLAVTFGLLGLQFACGSDAKPTESALKYGHYCPSGGIENPIQGTHTYYSAKVKTSRGGYDDYVESCFWQSQTQAADYVKNACRTRDKSDDYCLMSTITYQSKQYAQASIPIAQQPEPPPAGGGCYQEKASGYNIVCREKGSKSDCKQLYWAGCGWKEPPPPSDVDYDDIPDSLDQCQRKRKLE